MTVSAQSEYLKLVEKADKAIKADDYATAIESLNAALHAEPGNSGNVMLISNLGMLYYYTGADSMAIECLSLAHDMAPESITILSNRSKVYTETGQLALAMKDLDLLTEMDSTLYQPHLNKGAIYLSTGDIEKAETALRKMEQLTDATKSLECCAALAWLASAKGDNNEALKQYSNLILLEPSAPLYAARAISHVALEHYIEASEDISSGIELDPECSELYVARAYMHRKMYRNDDAMSDAQKAIDLGADPRRVRSLLNL